MFGPARLVAFGQQYGINFVAPVDRPSGSGAGDQLVDALRHHGSPALHRFEVVHHPKPKAATDFAKGYARHTIRNLRQRPQVRPQCGVVPQRLPVVDFLDGGQDLVNGIGAPQGLWVGLPRRGKGFLGPPNYSTPLQYNRIDESRGDPGRTALGPFIKHQHVHARGGGGGQ